MLLRLGPADQMFAGGATPTPTPTASPTPSPTPTVPVTPAPPTYTVDADDLTAANQGGLTVTGDLRPGGTITVQAAGFAPGERVDAALFSARTDLGSARADASGAVTATLTLPTTTTVGTHRLVLVGQAAGRTLWAEVRVLAAPREGSLAVTGADGAGLTALAALALLGAGTAAVLVRRRRTA